jgi:mRNA-degrading endonuclease toxin of MazEF toxin-antitoxin module
VPLTTNQRLANAPGNLLLEARYTRLRKPSVANVSQLYALDKRYFREYVSTIPEKQLEEVIEGILFLLGR